MRNGHRQLGIPWETKWPGSLSSALELTTKYLQLFFRFIYSKLSPKSKVGGEWGLWLRCFSATSRSFQRGWGYPCVLVLMTWRLTCVLLRGFPIRKRPLRAYPERSRAPRFLSPGRSSGSCTRLAGEIVPGWVETFGPTRETFGGTETSMNPQDASHTTGWGRAPRAMHLGFRFTGV